MVQWNVDLLSRWIAPGIAEFTNAEIPDLSGEFEHNNHWFQHHFLNSVLGSSYFTGLYRQYFMVTLIRVQHAFRSYQAARMATLEYLDGNQPKNPRIGRYLVAINEWESFSLQFQIVVDITNKVNNIAGSLEKCFEPKDGSPTQRMYEIALNVKHAADKIKGSKPAEAEAIPLWLSNRGLNSYGGMAVSFLEAADLLRDMAKLADEIQNPREFGHSERSG